MHSTIRLKKIISFLLLVFILSACANEIKPPQGSTGSNAPLYSKSKSIKLSKSDEKAFINEYLGIPDNFNYSINFSWSDDDATKIIRELEETYENKNWRSSNDWININNFYRYSWSYGDLLSIVILLNDITNNTLDQLEKKYGVSNVKEDSTLIVTILLDTKHKFESESVSKDIDIDFLYEDNENDAIVPEKILSELVKNKTQDSPDSTGNTNLNSDMPTESSKSFQTATVEQLLRFLTATGEAQEHFASETRQAETAVSISATQSIRETEQAIQINATAVAEAEKKAQIQSSAKQLLPTLNTEFDTNELSDTWTIIRQDPSRWNLTKFPGNLQLFGTSVTSSGYLNTFIQQTSIADMAIITEIEPRLKSGTASSSENRFISVGFSPNDVNDGYGTGVGIYYHFTHGYHAFFWACSKDYCASPIDAIIDDYKLPKNNTKSFLKLEREGSSYTGYYSPDGFNWTFLGKIENMPENQKTAQVVMKSGCVNCSDFHSRVNFIRYEVIED